MSIIALFESWIDDPSIIDPPLDNFFFSGGIEGDACDICDDAGDDTDDVEGDVDGDTDDAGGDTDDADGDTDDAGGDTDDAGNNFFFSENRISLLIDILLSNELIV